MNLLDVKLERLPRESDKAFAAFEAYVLMGSERTFTLAAQRVGKSRQMLCHWAKRNRWRARVQAHDGLVASAKAQAIALAESISAGEMCERRKLVRQTEWELAQRCLRRFDEVFRRLESVTPSYADACRLLELAAKLQRMAAGMATDRTEVSGEGGGPIRVELEAALKKVYGVAPPAAAECGAPAVGAPLSGGFPPALPAPASAEVIDVTVLTPTGETPPP
jgi:hypothetical protein